jgi:hypothetical protein
MPNAKLDQSVAQRPSGQSLKSCRSSGRHRLVATRYFRRWSSAIYFVGDPEEIADNVKVYREGAKLSALILSGRPLIEETETVSRLLSSALRRDPVILCPEEASGRQLVDYIAPVTIE